MGGEYAAIRPAKGIPVFSTFFPLVFVMNFKVPNTLLLSDFFTFSCYISEGCVQNKRCMLPVTNPLSFNNHFNDTRIINSQLLP